MYSPKQVQFYPHKGTHASS